ncbi:MAG: hypothetical protein J7647_10435 [Cyanobacteria bacterium SBLK]|nr:hypothetical protein [Cyanobacteria bacterium SBLK]
MQDRNNIKEKCVLLAAELERLRDEQGYKESEWEREILQVGRNSLTNLGRGNEPGLSKIVAYAENSGMGWNRLIQLIGDNPRLFAGGIPPNLKLHLQQIAIDAKNLSDNIVSLLDIVDLPHITRSRLEELFSEDVIVNNWEMSDRIDVPMRFKGSNLERAKIIDLEGEEVYLVLPANKKDGSWQIWPQLRAKGAKYLKEGMQMVFVSHDDKSLTLTASDKSSVLRVGYKGLSGQPGEQLQISICWQDRILYVEEIEF